MEIFADAQAFHTGADIRIQELKHVEVVGLQKGISACALELFTIRIELVVLKKRFPLLPEFRKGRGIRSATPSHAAPEGGGEAGIEGRASGLDGGRLRRKGAKSNPAHMCGVHIHIGAAGHDARSLRVLANLMASHEGLLTSAIRIDQSRIWRYCRTVNRDFLTELNRKKPQTMQDLADIWYTENGATCGRSEHYNDSRYHMLNLHATFTKGTIEFRLFQFANPEGNKRNGLHAGELKSYIQLCLALSAQAKAAKSASPKEPQIDNPKFAMRTWLIRLGFVGEEFETAREILTRNLAGDAAFRHGRTA